MTVTYGPRANLAGRMVGAETNWVNRLWMCCAADTVGFSDPCLALRDGESSGLRMMVLRVFLLDLSIHIYSLFLFCSVSTRDYLSTACLSVDSP